MSVQKLVFRFDATAVFADVSITCSFNSGGHCGYVIEKKLDSTWGWIQHKGSTPSSKTGPTRSSTGNSGNCLKFTLHLQT